MSKIKPIKRLWHQFGDLLEYPRLDAYEIYEVLEQARLIEGVAFSAPHGADLPTHYRETFGKPKLPYGELRALVRETLQEYCRECGIEYDGMAERSDADALRDEERGRSAIEVSALNRGDS
jgi:hypothetical protein